MMSLLKKCIKELKKTQNISCFSEKMQLFYRINCKTSHETAKNSLRYGFDNLKKLNTTN